MLVESPPKARLVRLCIAGSAFSVVTDRRDNRREAHKSIRAGMRAHSFCSKLAVATTTSQKQGPLANG